MHGSFSPLAFDIQRPALTGCSPEVRVAQVKSIVAAVESLNDTRLYGWRHEPSIKLRLHENSGATSKWSHESRNENRREGQPARDSSAAQGHAARVEVRRGPTLCKEFLSRERRQKWTTQAGHNCLQPSQLWATALQMQLLGISGTLKSRHPRLNSVGGGGLCHRPHKGMTWCW